MKKDKFEIYNCYFKSMGLYYACFYIGNREILEGEQICAY